MNSLADSYAVRVALGLFVALVFIDVLAVAADSRGLLWLGTIVLLGAAIGFGVRGIVLGRRR